MLKTYINLPVLIGSSLLMVTACNVDLPSEGASDDFTPTGYAEPLSDAEYQALSSTEQYQVASKLTGTLFKGIPVDEFFDMDNLDSPRVQDESFISTVREAINTDLSDSEREVANVAIDGLDSNNNPDPDDAKYLFNDERAKQLPLARIVEYPLSRDSFVHWMAYFLANTIMFSPAEEMESANINDVQRVFARLESGIRDRQSVRQIIRSHLPTVDRWRVSRSPENHALEAYELYLGLFETEEDSRRGGIACKDFYLTDEANGYELVQIPFANTEPQIILDNYYVTSCDDLHNVISGHPLVMPRACEVIINYLMAGRSLDDRLQMCQSIIDSGATTFEDIFKGILFSREYLLNTERPRSYEENLLPLLETLKWDPRNRGDFDEAGRRIFVYMTSTNSGTRQTFMNEMGWATMSLKIGRTPDVPVDTLSFANYHKAIREHLFRKQNSFEGNTQRGGLIRRPNGEVRPEIAALSPAEYLNFLFLNALQRKPNSTERNDLLFFLGPNDDGDPGTINIGHLFRDNGELVIRADRYDDIAREVFDYISRLPEFYYFKSVTAD